MASNLSDEKYNKLVDFLKPYYEELKEKPTLKGKMLLDAVTAVYTRNRSDINRVRHFYYFNRIQILDDIRYNKRRKIQEEKLTTRIERLATLLTAYKEQYLTGSLTRTMIERIAVLYFGIMKIQRTHINKIKSWLLVRRERIVRLLEAKEEKIIEAQMDNEEITSIDFSLADNSKKRKSRSEYYDICKQLSVLSNNTIIT